MACMVQGLLDELAKRVRYDRQQRAEPQKVSELMIAEKLAERLHSHGAGDWVGTNYSQKSTET